MDAENRGDPRLAAAIFWGFGWRSSEELGSRARNGGGGLARARGFAVLSLRPALCSMGGVSARQGSRRGLESCRVGQGALWSLREARARAQEEVVVLLLHPRVVVS